MRSSKTLGACAARCQTVVAGVPKVMKKAINEECGIKAGSSPPLKDFCSNFVCQDST